MYTIEIAYIFVIALLTIATLIRGSIELHQNITKEVREAMETEIRSHTEGNEKIFRPEEMIRGVTIFQKENNSNSSE